MFARTCAIEPDKVEDAAAPNKTAPFTTGVADSKRSKEIGDGKPKFLMTNLPIGDFANVWYWSVMFIISHTN